MWLRRRSRSRLHHGEAGLPDPATLQGFSTKAADKPTPSDVRSVVLQERDLAFYARALQRSCWGCTVATRAMRKGTLEVLHGQEELVDGSARRDRRRRGCGARLRRRLCLPLTAATGRCGCRWTPSLRGLHMGEGFLRSVFSPGQIWGGAGCCWLRIPCSLGSLLGDIRLAAARPADPTRDGKAVTDGAPEMHCSAACGAGRVMGGAVCLYG